MTSLAAVLWISACAPADSSADSVAAATMGDDLARRPRTGDWQKLASIDFTTMADQDFLTNPTLDAWTAGHRTAAAVFEIQNGVGLVMFPDNATNWTASGSWTAPYVSAPVEDLIGVSNNRHQWLAIVAEVTLDSTAALPSNGTSAQGATLDVQLSYGPNHQDVRYDRIEQRTTIMEDTFGTGIVRTRGGVQEWRNIDQSSFTPVVELQIRDGMVHNFIGTTFPTAAPEDGMTELACSDEGRLGYALDAPGPGQEIAFDHPDRDVVSLSGYNWMGSGRTIIWQRVEIWQTDFK